MGRPYRRRSAADGPARTVSSQSKVHWWNRAIAPSWQCSPPPSSSRKKTSSFGQVSASNTCCGWPLKNWSGAPVAEDYLERLVTKIVSALAA